MRIRVSAILFFCFMMVQVPVAFAQQTKDQVTKDLAFCLTRKHFVMYSETKCSACALERSYFGENFKYVPHINCDEERALCDSKKIHAYPTWGDPQGNQYLGAMPLDILSDVSQCTPKVAAVSDQPTKIEPPAVLSKEHLLGAFLAGLLSFLAPCLLPLLPSYFTVLTGFTFADLYGLNFERIRLRVFISSLFFVAGFSLVYTLLGVTGSIVGKILGEYLVYLLKFSGALLVILGLIQTGLVKIDALRFDYAWNVQRRLMKLGFLSAVIMGVAAALSWIPCVGPLLSSVLLLTAKSESVTDGIVLLFIYSMGLTLPFLIAGLFFPDMIKLLKDHRLALHRVSVAAGIFLMIFGILLIFNMYQPLIDAIKHVPLLGGL